MPLAFPDTLVGTDSHTTMINGLGVVGWGVGGIEAEAVLLGQPYHMLLPEVVGVRVTGTLPEGGHGDRPRPPGDGDAPGKGRGRAVCRVLRFRTLVLTLPDRATLANMSPEYGATIGFFPVDEEALRYLEGSGRSPEVVERVERVAKGMELFRTDETPDPEYTVALELDLGSVVPSVAGPKRPQDRIPLGELGSAFGRDLPALLPQGFSVSQKPAPAGTPEWRADGAEEFSGGGVAVAVEEREHPRVARIELDGRPMELTDGSIVIAAITSCTNTSNPSVMVGAGLLAKSALERGLRARPWVKTSMAPGSKVVTDYLEAAGLLSHLAELGFDVVGYGCTTCIGNSGPLPEPIAEAVEAKGLVVSSVLSGNRNFEARIHPLVRANYLASPMLVVAFALSGRVDMNLHEEPLGENADGDPVFLRDIWPSQAEIHSTILGALTPDMYRDRYGEVFEGDELWRALPLPEGDMSLYEWDEESTYIRNPPFFEGMSLEETEPGDIVGARVLALLGDSVTTDHISPAGAIPRDEPAGRYLRERGVRAWEFNTFGARRGNHEVMMRGTFGNVRIKNLLLDGKEGGYTRLLPEGEVLPIYEASVRYQAAGTPLVVLAGKEYGAGSSRDWAAKGTSLLGVRAVIAASYERIHRSNLVGMGVLPLQFPAGESASSLGLDGTETFDIVGIQDGVAPNSTLRVSAKKSDGPVVAFEADVRLDSDVEVEYYRNGGILHTVLRKLARGEM